MSFQEVDGARNEGSQPFAHFFAPSDRSAELDLIRYNSSWISELEGGRKVNRGISRAPNEWLVEAVNGQQQ